MFSLKVSFDTIPQDDCLVQVRLALNTLLFQSSKKQRTDSLMHMTLVGVTTCTTCSSIPALAPLLVVRIAFLSQRCSALQMNNVIHLVIAKTAWIGHDLLYHKIFLRHVSGRQTIRRVDVTSD